MAEILPQTLTLLFVKFVSLLTLFMFAHWLHSTSKFLQGCVDIASWRLALDLQQCTYVRTQVSQYANDVTLAY